MEFRVKPRIGITLGDPSGIGPELIAKLLALDEVRDAADVVLIGDPWLFDEGLRVAGAEVPVQRVESADRVSVDNGLPALVAIDTITPQEAVPGNALEAGGRSALAALRVAINLARNRHIDSIMFAPLNKQALHLAGFGFEDELRWFAHELDYDGYVTELNVLDKLWTSRVTSHVPLKDVAGLITEEGILDAIALIDRELERAGNPAPRIGVAGLNPHAGDGGNFGREEIDVIAPAVERAKRDGFRVEGPYPADTIFVRAMNGGFDAVVTMYHDQGQIAMKLMGFGRGVTVQGGLPVPVTTPGHGTAYDIVGKGVAKLESTRQAFLIAARMGANRRQPSG